MPSSATPRNRLELQAAGENLNTWGAPKLNNDISQIDASLDGWTFLNVSGTVILTSVNYQTDQSRQRVLSVIGGIGGTITIPSVEKWYLVLNNCTGTITVTTGSGTTITTDPLDCVVCFCDGANVRQIGYNGQGIKEYVNQLAWQYNAGNLPAQAGNAGKFVFTDGTNASWKNVTVANISDFNAARDEILDVAIAYSVAL